MPRIRKADNGELAVIHDISLRGVDGLPSDPLRASTLNGDEDPVEIIGATLTGINLTPKGFGYEVKLLIPLTEEEKLGALRRLAFQQLVNLNVAPASWEEIDD